MITYVITTVLFLLPFTPVTFTRAETGTSELEPTISILMGLPSKRTLLYRLRAAKASLLLVYTTSAEPCNQVPQITLYSLEYPPEYDIKLTNSTLINHRTEEKNNII